MFVRSPISLTFLVMSLLLLVSMALPRGIRSPPWQKSALAHGNHAGH